MGPITARRNNDNGEWRKLCARAPPSVSLISLVPRNRTLRQIRQTFAHSLSSSLITTHAPFAIAFFLSLSALKIHLLRGRSAAPAAARRPPRRSV